MNALKEKSIITEKDYFALEEGAPYQLIGGELIMSPAPNVYHQVILQNLNFILRTFVKKNKLGTVLFAPVDVRFSETEVYQPDLLYVSKEREGIIKEGMIDGGPDLVVEILSPSNGYYDLVHKKNIYLQDGSGVQEYWIIDPLEQTFQVLGREKVIEENGQGVITSKLFNGLKISLAEVFEK